jgi:hypothetical protein
MQDRQVQSLARIRPPRKEAITGPGKIVQSDVIPLPALTDKQLDELAAQVPLVKAWLKAVEELLTTRLENDAKLSKVALVPTQPRRYWKLEEEELLKVLRKFSKLDVVAPRTPLSPAQAEKTLGRKLFAAKLAELTARQSSGMKLAYMNEENEEEQ